MGKSQDMIPTGIAVLAAVVLSLFFREDTIMVIASLVVGQCALVAGVTRCWRPQRHRLSVFTRTLFPAVVFAAVAGSGLPLRFVFHLYRTDFDRVAAQIGSGTPPPTPFWIGPFKIKMVGRRGDHGIPYVATNEDESEIDGFVKHPDGHGFNLWSSVTLDEAWAYIAED